MSYPLGKLPHDALAALLMAPHAADAQAIVRSPESEGIPAHLFGHVEDGPVEVINTRGNLAALLDRPPRDEIARPFE